MSIIGKIIGMISGGSGSNLSRQLIFDKVIGFKGVAPGVGTSTIVQNVAEALSETTNNTICVIDTNFLYPTQYPMLVSTSESKQKKDYLDFASDLSDCIVSTDIKNVSLLSLHGRTIVDMISSKDSDLIVGKVIKEIKNYFDIILVDLSYETTNTSIYSAIKCNKIINVADHSLRCAYHLQRYLNNQATLAIPLGKANKVIFNKALPDVVSGVKGLYEEAGLQVVGEIPFSQEIAVKGVSGKIIWTTTTTSKDILAFSEVINTVVEDITQKGSVEEIKPEPLSDEEIDKRMHQPSSAMSNPTQPQNDETTRLLNQQHMVSSQVADPILREVAPEPKSDVSSETEDVFNLFD